VGAELLVDQRKEDDHRAVEVLNILQYKHKPVLKKHFTCLEISTVDRAQGYSEYSFRFSACSRSNRDRNHDRNLALLWVFFFKGKRTQLKIFTYKDL
jgi:hypothetical protein